MLNKPLFSRTRRSGSEKASATDTAIPKLSMSLRTSLTASGPNAATVPEHWRAREKIEPWSEMTTRSGDTDRAERRNPSGSVRQLCKSIRRGIAVETTISRFPEPVSHGANEQQNGVWMRRQIT
jgi:hypothetical protein